MDRSAVTHHEEEEEHDEEVRKTPEKYSEDESNVFPMDVDLGMDNFPPADDDEDGDALVPPAPPDSPEVDDDSSEADPSSEISRRAFEVERQVLLNRYA
jgi:hypothetical protein